MPLLDRVKERTGSDLSDAELQAMIDGITAELDARLGPAGPITVELGDPTDPASRERRTLRLARPADTTQPITIVEHWLGDSNLAANDLELADVDYRVLDGGRTLQRLIGQSVTGRMHWAPLVTVTYTPIGDQAQRDELTIKLITLDLTYRGLVKLEQAGDYRWQGALTPDSYATERESLFASLTPRTGMVMA
jgi:hypothetical protein